MNILDQLGLNDQHYIILFFHTSFPANYSLTFTEFGCIPVVTIYNVEGLGHFLSRLAF